MCLFDLFLDEIHMKDTMDDTAYSKPHECADLLLLCCRTSVRLLLNGHVGHGSLKDNLKK